MIRRRNARPWTTVSINREQYARLSRAARIVGQSRKRIVGVLVDEWSRRILDAVRTKR
jgi:hypothetical protein